MLENTSQMKTILLPSLILFTFSILFFSSCKKDDQLSTKDKFMGKWTYKTIKSTFYQNGEFVKSETKGINGATMEFKSDGTYDAIFTDRETAYLSEKGTWNLIANDKKVILQKEESFFVDTLSIEELTDNKLHFFSEEEHGDSGYSYKFEDEITLKK